MSIENSVAELLGKHHRYISLLFMYYIQRGNSPLVEDIGSDAKK